MRVSRVGTAFVVALGALAGVPAPFAVADARDAVRDATARTSVVHPGSTVRLAVDLAPAPRFNAEGTVTVLGWQETAGRLAPLGVLGHEAWKVGREGRKDLPVSLAV